VSITAITHFFTANAKFINALMEHVYLTLISLIIAIVIAIPLAVYARNHRIFAHIALGFTSIMQTIPSLAILGILIPIVGIGSKPAIIALVIYGILPIYSNTYTALTTIDPNLTEAAEVFGLTKWQRLFRIELPLSKDSILTGIKTSTVLIIGTATLAALIGAGGLGTFILLGIDRSNTALTLTGAIGSALLAVVFSWLITRFGRLKAKSMVIVGGTALLLLLLGIIAPKVYTATTQPERIVIAGKLGSEPDILINMYRDLIEAGDKKIDVDLKPNFGKTSFLFSALKSNQINIYPEFTGTVLEDIIPNSERQLQNKSATQIYHMAKNELAAKYNMTYGSPLNYNNTYTVVTTQKFAKRHHLRTISDLKKLQSRLHSGFDLEFMNRDDGYKGLVKKYGLSFNNTDLDPDLRYQAIRRGQVQVIDGYSTDSQIRQYHLVSLRDNKHLFPTYQGAPLMTKAFAKKHPAVVKQLQQLAGKITAKEMREMNYDVNVKKVSAAKVARHYLQRHHLLRK